METSAEAEGLPGARCRTVILHFDAKVEERVSMSEGVLAAGRGNKVWFDIEVTDVGAARPELAKIPLLTPEILDDALCQDPLTRLARYEDCVHFVISGCRPTGTAFELERVDVLIGENLIITLHRGPVLFMAGVLRAYRQDFLRFAQSLSFLVYEVWDHLIENYLSVQKLMEERVERLQTELRKDSVDDSIFAQLSDLGADLLHFRKVLLPARSVLADLSTRKSLFVSAATQPFLANMVGTVEHALQDLLVDRDILTESLNLYMSLVGHRTNEVMKRLTVVSVIFLPLTFLVGVYGMNFRVLPELEWEYGYPLFWFAAVSITVGLLVTLRRLRML